VEAATNAMAKFQGHPFFDKPVRITYAKSKSDIVAKRDGSFRQREKKAKTAPAARMDTGGSAQRTVYESNMSPSSILFAQNLPADCTDAALSILFRVHSGFKEVRMVPGKPGIAFIEFDDELKASTALQSLNGFKLTPTDVMALSYAKR
jgi:U2 small nuclear ribonucleoprotein B''